MSYPTGHRPDHPEVAKRRLGLHLHPAYGAMRAAPLPLKTTNRQTLPTAKGGPGVLNQADTSTCEGHGHATVFTLRLALALTPLAEVISPVGLVLGGYMVDRVPNPDGSLPYLIDQGTGPSSILTAAQSWGTCGAGVWGQYPASSGTMYIDPTGANPAIPQGACIEPPPEKLYGESGYKLQGAYFVQTTGLQRVLDILAALASGRPLSDAIPASGQDFQGYRGGILGPTSGDIDHCSTIIDYEWTGTPEQFTAWQAGAPSLDQYLVGYAANSWGTGWGESDIAGIPGGLYRFNRAFFDQLQDPCVADIVRAA